MDSQGRDVLRELSALVDTLTTSGSQTLDQQLFKQVKAICKSSDENVHLLYRLVMCQLEKAHAEIRLSSLQIINEIFTRSHAFRVLLTDNLQEFFALTLETNPDMPLPEPNVVAKTLKTQTFQAIEKWHEKYGSYYKKLALGYKYLKNVKKIRFDGTQLNSAVERQREEAGVARQANYTEQRLNRVLNEMAETVTEIKSIITEMGNCFHLILPSPEDFDIYKHSTRRDNCNFDEPSTSRNYHEPNTGEDFVQPSTSQLKTKNSLSQTLGGTNGPRNINITVNTSVTVDESKENADILNTLREQYKQIAKKYLPLVQKWLDILTKHSSHSQNLAEAIDLKNSLIDLQQKFKSLTIIPLQANERMSCAQNKESDDEDTFVDVPEKEGVEHIAVADRQEYGLPPLSHLPDQKSKGKGIGKKSSTKVGGTIFWSPNANSNPTNSAELGDPSSRAAAIAALARKQQIGLGNIDKNISDSRRESSASGGSTQGSSATLDEKRAALLREAPVVPFGMDLYHWGSSEEEAPSVSNLKSLHCFWVHGGDEQDNHCPGEIKESLKSRSIKFTGEFQGVKWSCRAPLPSGKLCPRKDLYKCPFHGTIIARDERGEPSEGPSREDRSLTNRSPQETARITKDIEAATGLNLTGSTSKRGKKRKHSGLTDLKKNANTSRSRLQKKIFNKSSLERVADEMDRVKKSLIDEKFGNNWNYALRK